MQYLTIPVAALLSPEFLASTDSQQATWLRLMNYCCIQENGGVVTNVGGFSLNMWRSLGVFDPRLIKRPCHLWRLCSNSLEISFYPHAANAALDKKRKDAVHANEVRWSTQSVSDSTATPVSSTSESVTQSTSESTSESLGTVGTVGRYVGKAKARPDLDQCLSFFQSNEGGNYSKDAIQAVWESFENPDGVPAWTFGGKPVRDWRKVCRMRLDERKKTAAEKSKKPPPPPGPALERLPEDDARWWEWSFGSLRTLIMERFQELKAATPPVDTETEPQLNRMRAVYAYRKERGDEE